MVCLVLVDGVAMKHPLMTDTMLACCGSLGYFLPYMRGEYPPHYPLPAIQTIVDIGETEINLWSNPVDIGPDLVEWRSCLVTWSIYGPPIYLKDNPLI